MREIKFRVWNKVFYQMTPLECLYFNQNSAVAGLMMGDETGEEWTAVKLEHIELMQYTGLEDKNGSGIYEGDILRLKLKDFADAKEVEFFVVNDFPFDVAYLYQIDEFIKDTETFDYIEVIGNIYENPELIGGGTE